MIVYGKEPFAASLPDFADRLRRRIRAAGHALDFDAARAVLVLAGQLEQAAADAADPAHGLCRAATRTAAKLFVGCWRSGAAGRQREQLADTLDRGVKLISETAASCGVEVRTPEGFAWYALYPDAYAQAAEGWAAAKPRSGRILVIGLRSIGTTLAAVVAAVLRDRALDVIDTTVRPTGDPFARRSELPECSTSPDWVLIADEGPGLSGSSMVSVAEAARRRGVASERIVFFAGHNHGPGPRASEPVRGWWTAARVQAVDRNDLRISGMAPTAMFAEEARRTLREPLQHAPQDVGGGLWRKMLDQPIASRLGMAPRLERPKVLVRGVSGAATLYKFAGLAAAQLPESGPLLSTAEQTSARLEALADLGWTVRPRGIVHGWLALPWVEGQRATAHDVCATTIVMLARYISSAAGPALSPNAAEAAAHRLRHMLVCNTRELFGSRLADAAQRSADALEALSTDSGWPTYGDGRLAPHEWVITSDGRFVKTDAGGHASDHTIVGRQIVLWDVAGAIVEWQLTNAQAEELAQLATQRPLNRMLLTYYVAAYAAFRGGVARFCAEGLAENDPDCTRLRLAEAAYAAVLARALDRLNCRFGG